MFVVLAVCTSRNWELHNLCVYRDDFCVRNHTNAVWNWVESWVLIGVIYLMMLFGTILLDTDSCFSSRKWDFLRFVFFSLMGFKVLFWESCFCSFTEFTCEFFYVRTSICLPVREIFFTELMTDFPHLSFPFHYIIHQNGHFKLMNPLSLTAWMSLWILIPCWIRVALGFFMVHDSNFCLKILPTLMN